MPWVMHLLVLVILKRYILRPGGFRDVGDVGGTYGEEAETDCSYELAGGHGGRHVCGLWCGVVWLWSGSVAPMLVSIQVPGIGIILCLQTGLVGGYHAQ